MDETEWRRGHPDEVSKIEGIGLGRLAMESAACGTGVKLARSFTRVLNRLCRRCAWLPQSQQLEELLARVERLCAEAAAACPVAEGAIGPDPAHAAVAGEAAVAAPADHSPAAATTVCRQEQEQRAQEPWVARARGVLEELAGAALRGRGWRSTLVGPSSRLARVLRACGVSGLEVWKRGVLDTWAH